VKDKLKAFSEKVKMWQVILVFTITVVGFLSPYVIKLDARWAKAEETFNSIQQVYQHSLKQSQRLDIKIAEDKLDKSLNDKTTFELKYGLDTSIYSDAEQQLYITIIKQWEKSTIEYNAALEEKEIEEPE